MSERWRVERSKYFMQVFMTSCFLGTAGLGAASASFFVEPRAIAYLMSSCFVIPSFVLMLIAIRLGKPKVRRIDG